jgi:hypothetical protein
MLCLEKVNEKIKLGFTMSQIEPMMEEAILSALKEAWEKHPDMRLTQLLINAIRPKEPCAEIYNIEDSRLIVLLNKLANR